MSDPPDLPRTLYHYSSGDGVRGIITSKTLWATDWRYTSDKTEFSYPREVLGRVAERMKATDASDDARWVLETVAGALVHASTGLPLYVACFCTEDDLPSQWEAHAGRGRGFALGFDRAGLYEATRPNDYNLGSLIYEVAGQEALLERVLTEAISLIPQYRGETAVTRTLLFGIGITLALTGIKNPRYSDEHEWRLMRQELDANSPQRWRTHDGRRIPYDTFSLENSATGESLLTEIIAGPSASPGSVEEIRRLLDGQRLGRVRVRRSTR